MTKLVKFLALPALALGAACSRGDARSASAPGDDALRSDLALASQQQYTPQQTVSPMEQGLGTAPAALQQTAYAPQPAYAAPAPRVIYRTRTVSSRASHGSGGYVYRAPAQPHRNTVRDGAVGAAAGAIIGATTSRDKVKGTIMGAAIGGVLGGIVGHQIDVDH